MSDYWKKKLDELNQSTAKTPSVTATSTYWKKKLEEQEEEKKTTTIGSFGKKDDFVPVQTVGTLSKKDDDLKWYEKGHFADGYDFGDAAKTILGISDKKELKTFTAPETEDTLEELGQKKDYLWGRKWRTPQQLKDAVKYTQQYNQMALAQYSETLSKTKMDGQNHTVLKEIEILANMEDGKEKDKRKQAVLEKMESLGMDTEFYSHFAGDGEFDWGTFAQWLGNSALAGISSFNKGILDTADVLLGTPLKALGWENNPISNWADYANDLYINNAYNADLLAEKLGGDAWNFASDAVEGTTGALPNAIMTFMTMGTNLIPTASTLATQAAVRTGTFLQKAGLTVETMMKNPQFWMSFSRTLGSDYKEAKESGASDTAASIGSVLKSFVNAGIEIGPGGDSGIQGLPQSIKDGGKPLWEWVESSLEEGGEEMLQKFVGEIIAKFGYGSDEEILNPIEYAKEGTIGAISGMALGGGQIGVQTAVNSVGNAVQTREANKLTADEQKVFDKIYEGLETEDMTAQEKKKLRDEVRRSLERGTIDLDTVEEILGHDSRSAYNALVKEYDEFNTLYDSETITERQRDRLNELKAKNEQTPYETAIKEARKKSFFDSWQMVRGTRLEESFRERLRAEEDFKADFDRFKGSKFEDSARKTLQSAIDFTDSNGKHMNNTNAIHDFVDLLANISSDRGTVFHFTNNEQLKGTEHYKEGFITDGFITNEDGSITINMDSPKALNFITGHEVTHSLEKSSHYKDLQDAVFQYAKDKGELDKYVQSVDSRYKSLDQDGKNREVTSDLVGRYLFTDYEFISNLSTNHRNVFQKVFDEIKYLCKMATAGSKAARDLERVKHQFEKAYRETKAKTESNYSLTPVEAVQPTSSAWMSGANTDAVRTAHPTLYAVDEDATETRNPTQVKNTVNSYRKVYSYLQDQGFDGKILDASSGLGLGTKAGIEEFGFNVEDIEPYPDKDYNPKYTDYSTLDEKYDAIISNAVLNVIPQDQRDALVVKMGEMLNPGGKMFINVRGKDVLNSSGKIAINADNMEYFIPRTAKTGSYQKGFTSAELKAYLEDALGDEFEVTDGRKVFGTSSPSAIVTRKGDLASAYAAMDDISRSYLENKSIQYSYSAIPTHKKSLEKNFDPANASMDLETITQRYDKIIDIWERLGGELDSKFLNDWNNKVERPFTIFKAQSGYKYNVELSSMCKKGVPLFEAIDTIVKKEVMKELDMDVMGKEEKEILYDILKQKHFEIPCAICYVEQARQREGIVIDAFLNGKSATDKKGADVKLGWNQVLDSIQKEMKSNGVDYTFNFVSRDIATDKYMPAESDMDEQTYASFAEAVKKLANEEITRYNQANGKNRPLLKDVTPEAVKECFKGGLPSNLKIFKVLLTEPSSRFKIQNDLLYSSMTTKNLTMAHNGLYSLFNSQGGVSGYKTKQSPTVYWGEILGKKWKPADTRKEGGVRNQSNSDFQMYTLLDQAQMYMDFSAKGYYLQAYTKVLSELKLFGLSRGKINASLIPQVKVYRNADGSVDVEKTMANAGLDENGNPIYDDVEGIDHREAFMLLEDPEYSKNIGGICIGYSDNHIRKLLDDNRVQLIIGFHDKTNDPNKRYRGARYAKNYNGLNEATKTKADGTSETVHIGFNPFVKKAENKFKYNSETETFEGTVTYNGKTYTADDIPRLATDLYLENCAKKGLAPAYKDFSGHPNYYKLLADFSLYDSEGHYAPHQKVAYNMPDSVPYLDADGNKQYMKSEDYIKIELQKELAVRDSLIDALADDSEDGIIPRFKAEVAKRNGTQYSLSETTDKDYLDAVKRGDTETMQKMVDEVAKQAGYSTKVYHGTQKFGFTKLNVSKSDDGISFFATEDLGVAGSYANQVSSGTRGVNEKKQALPRKAVPRLRRELKGIGLEYLHEYTQTLGYYDEWTMSPMEYITDNDFSSVESPSDFIEFANVAMDTIASVHENLMDAMDNPRGMKRQYPSVSKETRQKLSDIANKYAQKVSAVISPYQDSGVYGLYANTDNHLVIDAQGSNWDKVISDDLPAKDGTWTTRDIARYAKDNGYSGVTFKNIIDSANHIGRHPSTVYAFFNPQSQVKSADPVTYDRLGRPIPLSERFNAEKKDIRYSLSEATDNEGNQLTRGQEEFFKDSKIRDKDGNLRRVYHTTQNDFTVFDKSRKGEATDGPNTFLGFFFAESPDHMEQFPEFQNGKTDSYYLDMKKPMDLTNMSKETFMDIVELTGGDRIEASEIFDEELKAEQGRARLRGDSNTSLSLRQLLYTMVGDYYHADFFDALKPNYDKLIAKGYDGVIDYLDEMVGEREFVVFDSNQAKLTSNQNPTSDPDTRFSMTGDEGYDEYGSYNIYGKDAMVQDSDDLPIADIPMPEDKATADKVEDVEDIPEEDDIPIKTVAERLTAKRANSQTELDNNRRMREESRKSFDEKIAKAQAQLDSKKNKDTKVANNLRRRIERLQRMKADVDAQYAKRISDIESRLTKTDSELQKDHTKQDEYERTITRINRMFDLEKADLDAEFAQKRELIADKNSYISTKASELYKEIRGLKKGVKASEQLGYLLDHGYDWSSIRAALVNIKHTPGETVNINSEAESVAREMLNDDFEQAQFNLDSEYQNRLSELESEAEAKRQSAKTAHQRIVKSNEHTDFWQKLIGDTSTWVDLPLGLAYKTKTLRRILRKVVKDANGSPDFAKADAIYEALEVKYDHHEAELKKESHRLKKVFFDLDLNSKEDTYAHMLGELRHNPETTLTADAVNEYYAKYKKHIDTDKVNKAIEESRKLFDDLLIRVNNVLREQGMKEIPYRQGYFPHFTNPKQKWWHKALNWKPVDNEIPTSIAGLTEMFNPDRSWQPFNKERKGDKTDYSLYQGLDSYIHGALDWIYHIDDLQSRRSLENLIRYTHSAEGVKAEIDKIKADTTMDADEMQTAIEAVLKDANNPLNGLVTELRSRTNTLANKKHSMDRGMEEATNRKIYSTMTNLNNRINANQVVGSFSAALSNIIPIPQSWLQVSPVYTVAGMKDFIQSTIRDDGMVAKSDFLTNRLMDEEKLFQTGWDKASDKVAFMMNVIDNITSQTVWRSKYLQNIHEGMNEAMAIKDADQFAKNLMAGRSRGNAPSIFDAKNPLAKMFTAFQLEVANQYGYMFEDAPQDTKNKARLAKGYATAFLGAYAYNALYSSLVGRTAAFDPIRIIEELFRDLSGDDDDEEPVEAILNFAENVAQEAPYIGGLLGGGRIPMASAFPYSNDSTPLKSFLGDVESGWNEGKPLEGDWSNLADEMLKPLWYLAFPFGGGQARKTIQGLSMFDDDLPISGSYSASGKLRFPVEDTLGNKVKAALFGQYASKNARDYFDNGRSPMDEKQIQEFIDVDIPIRDYWEYREGLRGLDKIGEKADYIDSLDLPIDKKNLLINNIADRKDPIDLTGYGNYGSFEEFEFAKENPEKYEIAQAVGGYENYKTFKEGMKDMKLAEKVDYVASLSLTTEQKNILINGETDRKEPIDLTGYENFDSFEEFEFAKENPETYAVAKAVGGYDSYKQYSDDLNDIKADKDKYGKSVSGSRKAKVLAYINSLDADYYTKLILYKSEYNSYDDENNEIIDYLNNRNDLSYKERIAILRKLGFYVTDDGKISW